jgi:hypothetical protein
VSFELLCWNVEHFDGMDPARLARVVKHVKKQKPDVFALLEMEGADVRQLMEDAFPTYDFFITDGAQTQEILVGCRRGVFDQKAFTQKREFKEGNESLRPGALLSVRQGKVWTSMLFLHSDSGVTPGDFGNRAALFERVLGLQRALTARSGGDPRLLVVGDLNTMGMYFPTDRKRDLRISAEAEIAALADAAAAGGMVLLPKDRPATWASSSKKLVSNLDHVIATEAVRVVAPVAVRGWQDLSGEPRQRFLTETSDHCSLAVSVG